MITAEVRDYKDVELLPFLSHSRINRFLTCPEQYRLYYPERLRPRITGAALVFGQSIHESLKACFTDGEDPADHFEKSWKEQKDVELSYGAYENWEKLDLIGKVLMRKFLAEEIQRIDSVAHVEGEFTVMIDTLPVPYIGIIDMVGVIDSVKTIIDFKTSRSSYGKHEVLMSDQLTAYLLAEPDTEQTAFCVFVKKKDPEIEWHFARREDKQFLEYLDRAEHVAASILKQQFFKRPGKWCQWCDYLPVCCGDEEEARKTLVQLD